MMARTGEHHVVMALVLVTATEPPTVASAQPRFDPAEVDAIFVIPPRSLSPASTSPSAGWPEIPCKPAPPDFASRAKRAALPASSSTPVG